MDTAQLWVLFPGRGGQFYNLILVSTTRAFLFFWRRVNYGIQPSVGDEERPLGERAPAPPTGRLWVLLVCVVVGDTLHQTNGEV